MYSKYYLYLWIFVLVLVEPSPVRLDQELNLYVSCRSIPGEFHTHPVEDLSVLQGECDFQMDWQILQLNLKVLLPLCKHLVKGTVSDRLRLWKIFKPFRNKEKCMPISSYIIFPQKSRKFDRKTAFHQITFHGSWALFLSMGKFP